MARRAIWKGAITFGLVYIPVQMYSATRSRALDLDLLDKRDFAPVGYQRVNKRTGEPVEWGDIVKGFEHSKGEYVALTEEDFRQANVKATQTIEIVSFTDAANIPPQYFEKPYYLEPARGGAKVYALLREALKRSGKVAVATFVMRNKQHLAAIHPSGRALVLDTLRFAEEITEPEDLDLPAAGGKSAGLAERELAMAERLIGDMTGPWQPGQFRDSYRQDLLERIEEKVRRGESHTLTPPAKARERKGGAEVIDLMDALKRSLEERGGSGTQRRPARKASGRRGATARSRQRA